MVPVTRSGFRMKSRPWRGTRLAAGSAGLGARPGCRVLRCAACVLPPGSAKLSVNSSCLLLARLLAPARSCAEHGVRARECGEREQRALAGLCAVSFGFRLQNSCPMLGPSLSLFREEASKARGSSFISR